MKIVVGVLIIVILLFVCWVAKLTNEITWFKYKVEDYKMDFNIYKNDNHKKNREIMELNNMIRSLKPEVKEKVLDHMAEQKREIFEEQYSK